MKVGTIVLFRFYSNFQRAETSFWWSNWLKLSMVDTAVLAVRRANLAVDLL